MMNKVQQLTQNVENFQNYQRWCKDPMTQMVLDCMLELLLAEGAQPMKMIGQQGVSMEINALENAKTKGACECIARMVSFSDKKMADMPPEDYSKPWTGAVEQGGANQ